MKVAILGYGKMGKEIEKILLERNHQVVLKVTSENANFDLNLLNNIDVAIEFSTPKTAEKNIYKCIKTSTPIIIGTTGEWLNKIEDVRQAVTDSKTSLLYASNFSIGVNVLFKINETLAKIMNNFGDYKTEITETHHTQKLDSPSGTAITLANQILKNNNHYNNWIENNQDNSNDDLNIIAKRIANVPGTHAITYENKIDKIEIIHEAKNRTGFALGAVIAAEWIIKKQGIFTMSDVLKF